MQVTKSFHMDVLPNITYWGTGNKETDQIWSGNYEFCMIFKYLSHSKARFGNVLSFWLKYFVHLLNG